MKKRNHRNGKRKPIQQVVHREPSYPTLPQRIEDVLINGNLASLSESERVQLYMQTCKSLKLNPLTKPFGYILVKGWSGDDEKLILYATRNCTDQLRSVYGASDVPGSLKRSESSTELTAEIAVVGRNGRVSTDVGVIPMKQYSRSRGEYTLSGRDLANAKMHVVTKARRRATLALYGLGGIVDESELDTMTVVGGVTKEGRIWRYVSQSTSQRELVEGGVPTTETGKRQLEKVERLDQEFASEMAAPSLVPRTTASKPTQGATADSGESGDRTRPSEQRVKSGGGIPIPSPSPNIAREPLGEGKAESKGISHPPAKTSPNQPQPSGTVPKARIPHKITSVRWTKEGKGLVVELDTGHKMYTFRDSKMDEDGTKLFDILLNAVGQMAIFEVKHDAKGYWIIDKVIQIGSLEWDDGVPVLRREPGE
jgi:hypothetical protein